MLLLGKGRALLISLLNFFYTSGAGGVRVVAEKTKSTRARAKPPAVPRHRAQQTTASSSHTHTPSERQGCTIDGFFVPHRTEGGCCCDLDEQAVLRRMGYDTAEQLRSANRNHRVAIEADLKDGAVLRASADKKAKKDFILAAVTQENGGALQFASDELRADFQIVLAAVRKGGCRALEFASDALRGNQEIQSAARLFDWNQLNASISADREDMWNQLIARQHARTLSPPSVVARLPVVHPKPTWSDLVFPKPSLSETSTLGSIHGNFFAPSDASVGSIV